MRFLKRFGSKRMLAVNLALLALAAWAFAGEYGRDRAAAAETLALTAQADAIRDKNAERLAELDVTAAEVESEARLKLNLKRPGEEVVVVKGTTLLARDTADPSSPATGESNAAKWWKLFFE